ncbi:chaps-domain-containing protein [Dacryopinax primogenitus]|uniref:Chaps-domain-containing protein n=1 Tax=Dacryopinax primogenitus (strain DJM 731) TaxID=1858805 RepID=M5FTJ5_DACPD|nr:chaps-domain-containing protein [Dacryopinax primogenitus]EJT99413.1 chaps-domain-containing protein [Dacryopinax primogenitus]
MADTFKDVPEFFEVELGESLLSRTESLQSFRELGPPDLCHVVKSTGRNGQKDSGSYHYVSGVDSSSSASLAAYLNSLIYSLEEQGSWFGAKTPWKLRSGTYCCFNAFSRVDARVDVKIPGGVSAYIIDLHGDRHEATPELWQETYLSAVLRSVLYAEDQSYRLAGYRKLDPITTTESELRFLQAAEALFFRGWQLGSDPEIQVASPVSNHLVSGLLKYFGDSGRWQPLANLFEKLFAREPEVASLLAKSYIGMNEEVRAIRIAAAALESNPKSWMTLHVQVDFLVSKGKMDWAVKLAKQAVNAAPSEFVTWAKLAEVYSEMGQFESALLTLNSCPMFTYNERDHHRMPTPARTHLPVKHFITESGILDSADSENNTGTDADPALLRLPAPGLRGTFAKAYSVLAKLVGQIGWDELLKTRSGVFVMEEEYRNVKAMGDSEEHAGAEAEDEDEEGEEEGADDNASTTALKSKQEVGPNGEKLSPQEPPPESDEVPTKEGDQAGNGDIPTIKIHAAESEAEATKANGAPNGSGPEKPKATAEHQKKEKGKRKSVHGGEVAKGFSFTNKRLCERWLDNLFMVLYEDLRIWTIFRAEVAHFKTQHVAYRKTGTEWEILGDLGLRLHHKEEAKEAYQRCLDAKFSARAWSKLLEMYAEEGELQKSLNAAIRLSAFQQRWYMEMTYPTDVARYLYKVASQYGMAKLANTIISMGLPEGIFGIMQGYLQYGDVFRVEGYDW